MTVVITVLLVLLVVGLILLGLARSHAVAVTKFDDLAGSLKSIDLVAFENLVSPSDTHFLRQNLSSAKFRVVQRQRVLATMEYVRNIGHNARVLIQLGQMALLSPDEQVAQAARLMVDRAGHVRIMSTVVLMKLHVRSVLPAFTLTTGGIFGDYRNLTEAAVLFTRLQRPAFAGRVSAML